MSFKVDQLSTLAVDCDAILLLIIISSFESLRRRHSDSRPTHSVWPAAWGLWFGWDGARSSMGVGASQGFGERPQAEHCRHRADLGGHFTSQLFIPESFTMSARLAPVTALRGLWASCQGRGRPVN